MVITDTPKGRPHTPRAPEVGRIAALATLLTVALSTTTSVAKEPQNATPMRYRFTIDYFTFGESGAFRSKERVIGDYSKTPDGTAEWDHVTVAVAHALSESFPSGEPQAFMNGFRYRPGPDSTKAEFFKGFPPNATQEQNLVWDTLMFESFAKELVHVTGSTQYRLPPSDIPLAGSGTFQNRQVELTKTASADHDGQPFAVLHYEAFFNDFEIDLPGGFKMVGRSDYWGDIWVSPATMAVERATLSEEVLGNVHLPSQPTPQLVNVVRRGTFERLGG